MEDRELEDTLVDLEIRLRPLVKTATGRGISMAERRVKALKLRKEGYSYQAIGEELGVSDDTARKDVLEGLNSIRYTKDESAYEVRHLATERVNDAIKAIYESVLDGDLGAIDRLIRLNDQLLNITGAVGQHIDVTSGGKPISGTTPVHTIEVILSHDRPEPAPYTIEAPSLPAGSPEGEEPLRGD